MALSGAEHWMAVTAAFPGYFRSFFQVPVLYHFYPSFWGYFGSADDWTTLDGIQRLSCRVWAIALLGLGLWILPELMGLAHKSFGPHTANSTIWSIFSLNFHLFYYVLIQLQSSWLMQEICCRIISNIFFSTQTVASPCSLHCICQI